MKLLILYTKIINNLQTTYNFHFNYIIYPFPNYHKLIYFINPSKIYIESNHTFQNT